jgi:hypothetical protein
MSGVEDRVGHASVLQLARNFLRFSPILRRLFTGALTHPPTNDNFFRLSYLYRIFFDTTSVQLRTVNESCLHLSAPQHDERYNPTAQNTMTGNNNNKKAVHFAEEEEDSPAKTATTTTTTTTCSERSEDSVGSVSSRSLGSKALRAQLTRERHNRDPLRYYEVLSVLGAGSMGSVAKVRKRKEAVGGSARKRIDQDCCMPLLSGISQFFVTMRSDSQRSLTASEGSGGSGVSSILQPRTNIVEDYNDQHGEEQSGDLVYAMKSIHLSRVTNDVFLEELKNEISILKSLDHPHIVKAIETFEYRNQIFVVMELW